MASIHPFFRGGYRAHVHVQGKRASRVFPTKREARLWSYEKEVEFLSVLEAPELKDYTLLDALKKYSKEVSEHKKGKRWEQVRLKAFEQRLLPLDKLVHEVTTEDIELFRDSRLKEVQGTSVRRELSLLSSVFTTAKLDWKWGNENPCKDIRMPKKNPSRQRVLEWWEVKRMLRGLGYAKDKPITRTYQAVGACLLLALRTGMRAGELTSLRWENVKENYVHLPDTKNGTSRDVPLCSRSRKLIAQLQGWDDEFVIGVSSGSLDAIFRRIRDRNGLSGFTFHDARHTAATMIAKNMHQLGLCRMFGWKDPKMALVYYNPSVSDLAAMLG